MSMLTISEADRTRIKHWQWGILALAVLAEIFLAADWYGFAANFVRIRFGLSRPTKSPILRVTWELIFRNSTDR